MNFAFTFAIGLLVAFASSTAFAAEGDSVTVTVVGRLHTGLVAIGGETTGATITAKGITWELDFGKHDDWRKAAEKFDGKKVNVQGTLERKKGVEIKERWIVTVTAFSGG